MKKPLKYKKKPIVITALQWTGDNWNEMCDFLNVNKDGSQGFMETQEMKIKIHTLEGDMTASMNDFIIRGVYGEFYPCKPDIFHETYDEIKD